MASVQEIEQRWLGFLEKVKARALSVIEESEAGFDQLIGAITTDHTPVSRASIAVRQRLLGLSQKIGDNWDKIDEELDDAPGGLDRRDALYAHGEALRYWVDEQTHLFTARKEADAARRLQEMAKQEMSQPMPCSQCGAPLATEVRHMSVRVNCSACDAVNTTQPGPATMYFFSGGCTHQLAEHAASEAWLLMQRAERRYHDSRKGLDSAEFKALEQATANYWKVYCDAQGAIHPAWDAERRQREFDAKMGNFRWGHDPHSR